MESYPVRTEDPNYRGMSDEELIALWQDEHNDRAAAEIDRRWRRRLVGYFFKNLEPRWRDAAEDLAQETLFRVFRSKEFETGEGGFSNWIYGIANNVLRDHWRRQNTQKRKAETMSLSAKDDSGPTLEDKVGSSALGPDRGVTDVEFAGVLQAGLAELTPRARFVVLAAALDVPLQEVGEILGRSYFSARRYLHEANSALRAGLDSKAHHSPDNSGVVKECIPAETWTRSGLIPGVRTQFINSSADLKPTARFELQARALGVPDEEIFAILTDLSAVDAKTLLEHSCKELKKRLNDKGYYFKPPDEYDHVVMRFPDEFLVYEKKSPQGGKK